MRNRRSSLLLRVLLLATLLALVAVPLATPVSAASSTITRINNTRLDIPDNPGPGGGTWVESTIRTGPLPTGATVLSVGYEVTIFSPEPFFNLAVELVSQDGKKVLPLTNWQPGWFGMWTCSGVEPFLPWWPGQFDDLRADQTWRLRIRDKGDFLDCEGYLVNWKLTVTYDFLARRSFSGQVFNGLPGDTSEPMEGVRVELYGAQQEGSPNFPGTFLRGANTDEEGGFVFHTDDEYAFYNMYVYVPGESYTLAGSIAGNGGTVRGLGWIQYANPPYGDLGGNQFFIAGGVPPITSPYTFAFNPPVYDGVQDTYIDGWEEQGTNFGGKSLAIRTGGARAALLQYDLTGIPDTATVEKATLRLYIQSRSNSGPMQIVAYPVQRAWVAGEANWLMASAGEAWGTPGLDAPADRTEFALGMGNVPLTGYIKVDVTDLVQQWIADPDANLGMYLSGIGASCEVLVGSSEAGSLDWRPALTVEWTE